MSVNAKKTNRFGLVGSQLDKEIHVKYDVRNLPYQNLNPTHPMRVAWESKEKETAAKENRELRKFSNHKDEVAMRPSDKAVGREYALSYGKLVRQTAIRLVKDGIKLPHAVNDTLQGDALKENLTLVKDAIYDRKERVFQNLIWTVGLDALNFGESLASLNEVVGMFLHDVMLEIPHGKTAAGGKSKAEILKENDDVLLSEAYSFMQRMASGQDMSGVTVPKGAIAFYPDAWNAYMDVILENEANGLDVSDVKERMDAFKEQWSILFND